MKVLCIGIESEMLAELASCGIAAGNRMLPTFEAAGQFLSHDPTFDACLIRLGTNPEHCQFTWQNIFSLSLAGIRIPVVILAEELPNYPWTQLRAQVLDQGAEDLIRLPASHQEVAASLRHRLRPPRRPARLAFEGQPFHLETAYPRCFVGERSVSLAPLEWQILRVLRDAAPQPVSREKLLLTVYEGRACLPSIKVIDVSLSKLRKKLTRVGVPGERLIENIWGNGYRLALGPLPVVDSRLIAA